MDIIQDTCKEPVVLIGGGFISCEVAAAIASHCQGMQLVMVMPHEDVMASSGFGKEVCHFYEKQLARVRSDFDRGSCLRENVALAFDFFQKGGEELST